MIFSSVSAAIRVQRSFTRRTNFNPDQTTVTAHTFTSTKPASSPISRTLFSSTSVATPELLLGQLTHSIPGGASNLQIRLKSFVSCTFDFVKTMAKSSPAFPSLTVSHPASAVLNSASTSGGASTRQTRAPGLIPNFFGSGVPEYPGMLLVVLERRFLLLWR